MFERLVYICTPADTDGDMLHEKDSGKHPQRKDTPDYEIHKEEEDNYSHSQQKTPA
jgi:hypothetical protein